MKLHVTKVHTEKLKSLIDSDKCVEVNVWLDVTSFRSIKDIEKEANTFAEVSYKRHRKGSKHFC